MKKETEPTLQSSPMTDEMRHRYCKEAIAIFDNNDKVFLDAGKRMHEIKKYKLFKPFWESWGEFVMELGEEGTKITRLMAIHKRFVMNGIPREDLMKVRYTKLIRILPMVKTADEAKYWVEQAIMHPSSILGQMIAEAKTGKAITECDHEGAFMLCHCNLCKQKWGVFDLATITEMDVYTTLEEFGIEVTIGQAKDIFDKLAKKAYETTKPIPDSDEGTV